MVRYFKKYNIKADVNKIYKKIFGPPFEENPTEVPAPPDLHKLNIGDYIPNFSLPGADGIQYNLEDYW